MIIKDYVVEEKELNQLVGQYQNLDEQGRIHRITGLTKSFACRDYTVDSGLDLEIQNECSSLLVIRKGKFDDNVIIVAPCYEEKETDSTLNIALLESLARYSTTVNSNLSYGFLFLKEEFSSFEGHFFENSNALIYFNLTQRLSPSILSDSNQELADNFLDVAEKRGLCVYSNTPDESRMLNKLSQYKVPVLGLVPNPFLDEEEVVYERIETETLETLAEFVFEKIDRNWFFK
ncbi:hypothetical protein HOC32_04175 [Candidatus Woesearchaeota archaeon]|nr:hypothetical protein [Candidatus Woesearchaeota archaeon]